MQERPTTLLHSLELLLCLPLLRCSARHDVVKGVPQNFNRFDHGRVLGPVSRLINLREGLTTGWGLVVQHATHAGADACCWIGKLKSGKTLLDMHN